MYIMYYVSVIKGHTLEIHADCQGPNPTVCYITNDQYSYLNSDINHKLPATTRDRTCGDGHSGPESEPSQGQNSKFRYNSQL